MINLYINNSLVDLSEDFDLLITRSIADIREPEKRQSDWSKTITIPGTKVNKTIFGNLFDVSTEILGNGQFAPTFNPNKKADVLVLVDGIEQLRGFIRLIQINVIDHTQITFECSLHGQTADLFTTIQNLKLRDLDFGEYNHTLNKDNVTNSWASSIIKNGSSQPFQLGEGYVYAQVFDKYATKGQDATKWRVDDHIPCLYAKTIVDKIFSQTGYKYTSDSFFNTDRFKHLIVPFNNYLLNTNESTALQRLFQAQVTGSTTYVNGQTVAFNNDSTGGNFDNGGNFNTTTHKYIVPVSGRYVFYLDLQANATFNTAYTNVYASAKFNVYKNTTLVDTIYITSDNYNPGPGFFTYNFNSSSFAQVDALKNDQITIVYVNTGILIGGIWYNASPTLTITSNTYLFNKVSSATFGYNNILEFASFFTGEFTQKDFILNFVKMFNLYIEPDYENPKLLRITPRDDFYNGLSQDWTHKLDYSQPVQIIPMGDMDANPYNFTYKEGDDDYSKDYKDSTNKIYGERIINIDNDFVKNEKKVEVSFASTMFKQDTLITQRYYSLINSSSSNGSIRVLYYSGLKNTTAFEVYETNPGTGSNYTQYPLTLHIDDVDNMQFDLNFGMSKYVLAGAGLSFSNQNLVNIYWYKTIKEITDKNSKIFKGKFKITPADWLNIRFNDIYFFENQYWRLNKISDYNPLMNGVYDCEFLLLTYYQPTNAVTKSVGLGTSDYLGNSFPYDIPKSFQGVRNGGVNIGNTDFIGMDVINVSDNTVSMGLRLNTNLGGSGNIISDNFSNVNLLSCHDFIPATEDKTYLENYALNGAYLSGGNVIELTDTNSPYTILKEDYLIVCNTNHGDINLVLPTPSASNKGKTFVVKKTDTNHKVDITAGDGSILIDDSTLHEMGNTKTSHHFISTGSKYYVIVP